MMMAAVRPQRTSAIENMALSAAITTSQAAIDAGAAAEAAALHQSDSGHGQAIEAVDGLGRGAADAPFSSAEAALTCPDPLEVGAGLEMPAVALEHDHAQLGLSRRARPWPRAGP